MNPFRSAALAALMLLAAPSLALAHNGLVHNGCPTGQSFTIAGLTVTGAYTRAMLPNAGAAGGYLVITNTGSEADTLIGASSAAAALVQIHEMKIEGDMMKMAEVEGGLEIAPGASVELAPKGFHLMFMQIGTPFKEGDCVEVLLKFAKAGELAITLNIGGVAQDEPVMDHGAHAAPAAHGDHAGQDAAHASGQPAIAQTGLSDIDAITALQTAMFHTPENPLEMGPIVVAGDYAVSDWAQAGAGGRALLRKTSSGWAIHLCAGAGLKSAAELEKIGVPAEAAAALAHQLAAAEAGLDAARIALYDSFNGTMMVDEALI